MAYSGNTGLKRLIKAGQYSWQGARDAYLLEEAFRLEVWALAIAVPLALWLGENGLEKALLIGSVLLVMVVELLNSAIEAVVDRISVKPQTLEGRAKDMGSAAVTLAIVNAALLWFFLLS